MNDTVVFVEWRDGEPAIDDLLGKIGGKVVCCPVTNILILAPDTHPADDLAKTSGNGK